jgi:hypothetical protein
MRKKTKSMDAVEAHNPEGPEITDPENREKVL